MKYTEINRELKRNERGRTMINASLSKLTEIFRNHIIIDIEGMTEENIVVDNITDGIALMIDGYETLDYCFNVDIPAGIGISLLMRMIEESPTQKINVSKILDNCYL